MSVTWETVAAFAPEIPHATSPEQARITTFIALATPRVSSIKFGDSYDLAVTLLTAHMLTRAPSTGGGGATPGVLRKKIGQVEIEYAGVPSGFGADYGTTGYGQQFLQLRNERVTPATAVGVDLWLEI